MIDEDPTLIPVCQTTSSGRADLMFSCANSLLPSSLSSIKSRADCLPADCHGDTCLRSTIESPFYDIPRRDE